MRLRGALLIVFLLLTVSVVTASPFSDFFESWREEGHTLFTGLVVYPDDTTGFLCDDYDIDGFCVDMDCDDTNPNTFPGALEICDDFADNNCNGLIDEGCDLLVGGPGLQPADPYVAPVDPTPAKPRSKPIKPEPKPGVGPGSKPIEPIKPEPKPLPPKPSTEGIIDVLFTDEQGQMLSTATEGDVIFVQLRGHFNDLDMIRPQAQVWFVEIDPFSDNDDAISGNHVVTFDAQGEAMLRWQVTLPTQDNAFDIRELIDRFFEGNTHEIVARASLTDTYVAPVEPNTPLTGEAVQRQSFVGAGVPDIQNIFSENGGSVDYVQSNVLAVTPRTGTTAEAGTSTGVMVTFKNTLSSDVVQHLTKAPIGFPKGQFRPQDLETMRLLDITTQTMFEADVQKTSHYPDGSVKTAVVHTFVTLQAGEQKEYDLVQDLNPPDQFVWHPDVEDFFANANKKITSISKDIQGAEYSFTLPARNQMDLLFDGSIMKVYAVTKPNRPTGYPNHNADLTHLGSTVFYITVFSNTPYLGVTHAWVNSHSFADMQWNTGQSPWRYAELQNNDIFYDSLRFEISTAGSAHTFRVLDEQGLDPLTMSHSRSDQTIVNVMPTDGQRRIGCSGDSRDGPCSVNGQDPHNYINAGQIIFTQGSLYFGTPRGFDLYHENPVEGWTSLSNWMQLDDTFFSALPDTASLGASGSWDFHQDSQERYNDQRNNMRNGHRFSADYMFRRAPANTGDQPTSMDQLPRELRYFMTCGDNRGCHSGYIKALRYWNYDSALTLSHVGMSPHGEELQQHRRISWYGYRSDPFAGLMCDTGWWGYAPDLNGYEDVCFRRHGRANQNYPPPAHRFDGQLYSTTAAHGYQWYDAAHLSIAYGSWHYMLTGDYFSRYIAESVLSTNAMRFDLYSNHMGFIHTYQVRGLGRFFSALADAQQIVDSSTKKQYYATIADDLMPLIRGRQQNLPPRTHPVTQRPLPEKGWIRPYSGCFSGSGPNGCTVAFWQDSLVHWGVVKVYKDMDVSASTKNVAEDIMDDWLTMVFDSLYIEPWNVLNGVAPAGTTVNEGDGYLPNSFVIGTDVQGSTTGLTGYTKYNADHSLFYQWTFWPTCSLLKHYSENNRQDHAVLKDKAERMYKAYRVFWPRSDLYSVAKGPDSFYAWDFCPVSYLLDATPSGNRCEDRDGDGVSTCLGDCVDSDAQIYPHKAEVCGDNVDNNCNGLVDCDDRDCGTRSLCNNVPFCGDLIIQTPNAYGRQEACDVVGHRGGQSSCSDGCAPAYVYSVTQNSPQGRNCACGGTTSGDRDGDGVPDGQDQCPNTDQCRQAGYCAQINSQNGCPIPIATQFGGGINEHLRSLPSYFNVQNLVLAKEFAGGLFFRQPVDLVQNTGNYYREMDLDAGVTLASNTVGVDGQALPELNVPARIMFHRANVQLFFGIDVRDTTGQQWHCGTRGIHTCNVVYFDYPAYEAIIFDVDPLSTFVLYEETCGNGYCHPYYETNQNCPADCPTGDNRGSGSGDNTIRPVDLDTTQQQTVTAEDMLFVRYDRGTFMLAVEHISANALALTNPLTNAETTVTVSLPATLDLNDDDHDDVRLVLAGDKQLTLSRVGTEQATVELFEQFGTTPNAGEERTQLPVVRDEQNKPSDTWVRSLLITILAVFILFVLLHMHTKKSYVQSKKRYLRRRRRRR